MRAVVLDSEAINLLASRGSGRAMGKVRAALTAAQAENPRVLVPANVLAEVCRGGAYNQRIDSCLGRHTGIEVVPTDRALAKLIGGLLAAAALGSEHNVDATVVAVALSLGGGIILTGDPRDLTRIAGTQTLCAITIETL